MDQTVINWVVGGLAALMLLGPNFKALASKVLGYFKRQPDPELPFEVLGHDLAVQLYSNLWAIRNALKDNPEALKAIDSTLAPAILKATQEGLK